MSFQAYTADHLERCDASGSRPRTSSKPQSILKKFKSFVCLRTSDELPCHSEDATSAMQRRTEALRANGLLPQSKIYGQQPYRDDAPAMSISQPEMKEMKSVADKRDLISFEDVADESNRGCLASHNAQLSSEWNFSRRDMCDTALSSKTPTPPHAPRSIPSLATYPEGEPVKRPILTLDTGFTSTRSTLPPANFHSTPFSPNSIRMRRMGSLKKETEAIEDAESRRLTEIAFLS